jgi:flagellar assembly protein FliH
MRSLSKVFKDGDIIMGSGYYLIDEGAFRRDAGASPAQEGSGAVSEKREEPLWRSRADAREIIEKAQQISRKILESTVEKAKTEEKNAEEAGYSNGFEAGRQEAANRIKTELEELVTLVDSLDRQKEAILARYQDDLKDLALGIARKIIDTELETGDRAFISMFQKAVQEMNGQEWVKVTVSDFEAAVATSNAEFLRALVRNAKKITIVPVEGAPRGTCVIETPQCIADAGVDTQLARLREAFSDMPVPI